VLSKPFLLNNKNNVNKNSEEKYVRSRIILAGAEPWLTPGPALSLGTSIFIMIHECSLWTVNMNCNMQIFCIFKNCYNLQYSKYYFFFKERKPHSSYATLQNYIIHIFTVCKYKLTETYVDS
jgi:hypothetical protein